MAIRQEASTGEFVDDKGATTTTVKNTAHILRVKVWSPFQVYYDDVAASISGVNSTGPFDILPQHRNFITLLIACDLVLQTKEGEIKIRISGGFMQVHKNVVTVFLEV